MSVAIGDRLINPPEETPYGREIREGWEQELEDACVKAGDLPDPKRDGEAWTLTEFSENVCSGRFLIPVHFKHRSNPEKALMEAMLERVLQLREFSGGVVELRSGNRKYKVTLEIERA